MISTLFSLPIASAGKIWHIWIPGLSEWAWCGKTEVNEASVILLWLVIGGNYNLTVT